MLSYNMQLKRKSFKYYLLLYWSPETQAVQLADQNKLLQVIVYLLGLQIQYLQFSRSTIDIFFFYWIVQRNNWLSKIYLFFLFYIVNIILYTTCHLFTAVLVESMVLAGICLLFFFCYETQCFFSNLCPPQT